MDKPESFYKFTGCFHQGTWEYYKDKGEDALIAGAAESLEKKERDELATWIDDLIASTLDDDQLSALWSSGSGQIWVEGDMRYFFGMVRDALRASVPRSPLE